jgi:cytochrome c553
MPSHPWRLAPHETNHFEAIMDLRKDQGFISPPGAYYRDIEVMGDDFTNRLRFTVVIPPDLTNDLTKAQLARLWGQQLAAVDHQAVFKNQCVRCHLVPAFGKSGEYLFHTTCGICHESPDRAKMVPDLSELKTEIDTNYWRQWVAYGKVGTFMPGFASTEGGPLDDEQIRGLVDYLSKAFPRPLKGTATNSVK